MPDSRVDTPAPVAEKMTFNNGNVVTQFTESGIVELTVGEHRAKLAQAPGDAVPRIAAAASTPVPAAKLVGTSGSLTVSATPNPAPAADPPPPCGCQPKLASLSLVMRSVRGGGRCPCVGVEPVRRR
jgi:hypothetical protein